MKDTLHSGGFSVHSLPPMPISRTLCLQRASVPPTAAKLAKLPIVDRFDRDKTSKSGVHSNCSKSKKGRRLAEDLFLLFEQFESELRILTTVYLGKSDHRWVTSIARGPVRTDVDHRLQVHGLEIDLGFYFNAPVRVEFRSAALAAALTARRVQSPKLIKNVSNPKRQDPKNLPNISEFGG